MSKIIFTQRCELVIVESYVVDHTERQSWTVAPQTDKPNDEYQAMSQERFDELASKVTLTDAELGKVHMSIKELIQNNVERNAIQTGIIETLEKHNQKRLTKRHIDELKTQVDDSIYLSKRFGMTHIEWKVDGKEQSLLISHDIKNVVIDTVDIVDRNKGYFECLRERNKRRMATLNNPQRCKQLEDLIKNFQTARHILETALEAEGDFGPDRHTIKETFDLEGGC